MLTRDEILNAEDLKTVTVDIPEWGGELLVREMTGSQRDAYETDIMNTAEDHKAHVIRARMVASSVVGEDGEPLFTMADVEALAKKSAKALDRVFTAAASLNVLTDDAVEEAAGN